MRVAVLMFAVVACACGPSAAQIQGARSARYTAPVDVVLDGVARAIDEEYEVEGVDGARGIVRTVPRWYEPDGTYEGKANDGSTMIRDGSIYLAIVATLDGEPGAWTVRIEPLAVQHVGGSPQPRQLAPDDPAMPGWVTGKIDNLYIKVHERLKAHAVP